MFFASDLLSNFDKGVSVAVLTACGIAGYKLMGRWFKSMDAMEERDKGHLKTIQTMMQDHHREMLEVHRKNAEERQQFVTVLKSIADGMSAMQGITSKK